jgi:hypothetical protein
VGRAASGCRLERPVVRIRRRCESATAFTDPTDYVVFEHCRAFAEDLLSSTEHRLPSYHGTIDWIMKRMAGKFGVTFRDRHRPQLEQTPKCFALRC